MKRVAVLLVLIFFMMFPVILSAGDECAGGGNEGGEKKSEVHYTSIGGGMQVLSETILGDHTYTDFFLRGSVFMKGNIVPKKFGYFAHIMSTTFPDYKNNSRKVNQFLPVCAFVWMKPNKFLDVKVGNLKKPSEFTYLPCCTTWTFEKPPLIFGMMKKDEMSFTDTGIQVVANYKKMVFLQLNAFRTDNSFKDKKFNLLYFAGLKIVPPVKAVKAGLFGYYGFEPHKTYIASITTVTVQRSSILAGGWVGFKGAKLFVEYINYIRDTGSKKITSSDLNVELSYLLRLKPFSLRPKVRYDAFDPDVDNDNDGKSAVTAGVDLVIASNPKKVMEYRLGIEYQLNMEEGTEKKNDTVRLVFQVGNLLN